MKWLVAAAIAFAGILVSSQGNFQWHWWNCGTDKIEDGHYIRTYTTGKEVIVCDEMFNDMSFDGYVHGGGQNAAMSCVLVKGPFNK